MKTLLIFLDHTGKEIARYKDAETVPAVGDVVTHSFKDWVVQNRKWDTTAKTFGDVVFVRVGEQWPKA